MNNDKDTLMFIKSNQMTSRNCPYHHTSHYLFQFAFVHNGTILLYAPNNKLQWDFLIAWLCEKHVDFIKIKYK